MIEINLNNDDDNKSCHMIVFIKTNKSLRRNIPITEIDEDFLNRFAYTKPILNKWVISEREIEEFRNNIYVTPLTYKFPEIKVYPIGMNESNSEPISSLEELEISNVTVCPVSKKMGKMFNYFKNDDMNHDYWDNEYKKGFWFEEWFKEYFDSKIKMLRYYHSDWYQKTSEDMKYYWLPNPITTTDSIFEPGIGESYIIITKWFIL